MILFEFFYVSLDFLSKGLIKKKLSFLMFYLSMPHSIRSYINFILTTFIILHEFWAQIGHLLLLKSITNPYFHNT